MKPFDLIFIQLFYKRIKQSHTKKNVWQKKKNLNIKSETNGSKPNQSCATVTQARKDMFCLRLRYQTISSSSYPERTLFPKTF